MDTVDRGVLPPGLGEGVELAGARGGVGAPVCIWDGVMPAARHTVGMAKYALNEEAVDFVRTLIDKRRYVLRSDWGQVQPEADRQNAFLRRHSWSEYARWHLGLTEKATDGTKARYAFVVGDFRRVHRSGLIACVYRAAEWRHKDVELAAHDLLQHLDRVSA